ncbi:MAG: hypothetical protein ACPGJU_07885 [Coraliomargarita sp.]
MARGLKMAGIEYQQDYCEGIYSTDFLIEKDGRRIALECKANIERDLEKTIAQCELIAGQLRLEVYIVTPYAPDHCPKDLRTTILSMNELAEAFVAEKGVKARKTPSI